MDDVADTGKYPEISIISCLTVLIPASYIALQDFCIVGTRRRVRPIWDPNFLMVRFHHWVTFWGDSWVQPEIAMALVQVGWPQHPTGQIQWCFAGFRWPFSGALASHWRLHWWTPASTGAWKMAWPWQWRANEILHWREGFPHSNIPSGKLT